MKKQRYRIYLDQPAIYQIRLLGRLGREWSTTFENMNIQAEKTDQGQMFTTICGTVTDQAALHGMLNQVRDLGMLLLLVERLSD